MEAIVMKDHDMSEETKIIMRALLMPLNFNPEFNEEQFQELELEIEQLTDKVEELEIDVAGLNEAIELEKERANDAVDASETFHKEMGELENKITSLEAEIEEYKSNEDATVLTIVR